MNEKTFKVFTAKKSYHTSMGTIRVWSESDGMVIGAAENEIDALLDALSYKEKRQKHYQNLYNDLLSRLEAANFVLLENVNDYNEDRL